MSNHRSLTCASVLLGLALTPLGAGAATRPSAEPDKPLTARLDALLDAYEIVDWDVASLRRQAAEGGRVDLVLPDGLATLQLEPYDLRVADMPRYVADGGVPRREQADEPQHYKGVVVGQSGSDVRLTLSSDLAMGYVRRGAGYVFIEPLISYGVRERVGVVLYRDTDIKPEAAVAFDQLEGPRLPRHLAQAGPSVTELASTFTPRVLELATEADGEFTLNHAGGSTATANSLIQGYVATWGGILQSEINMSVRLVAQFASANAATDPFDGTIYGHGPLRGDFGSSSAACHSFAGPGLWEQFRNLWNTELYRGLVRRDVAALYTGRDLKLCATKADPTERELFGSAGAIGSVCAQPTSAYAILELYPVNAAGLLGHELGHALGASHDGVINCPTNPIMCGTVDPGASTYSTASENAINGHFSPVATNGACVRPPTVAASVTPGSLYDFSDPTPPGVAREETITVRNVGGADLHITNPGAVIAPNACFQQVFALPSLISPGGSAPLRVRLLCSTRGTKTASASIQSDDPLSPYAFTLRGSVEPGSVYDVRLTATYVPSAGAPRATHESLAAHPTQVLGYFFDPNLGSFEERPAGACNTGGNNPTYFKLSLRGNAQISSCTFKASWDPTELACPPSAVNDLNLGREIVINTDDVLTDLNNCQLKYASAGVLQQHVGFDQEHSMLITFVVGDGRYVRRVRFSKVSQVTYSPMGEDTYVDEAAPDTPFSGQTPLRVRGGTGQRRHALLSTATGAAAGTIRSARLYLDVQGSIGGLRVFRVAAAPLVFWSAVTWNNWQSLVGPDAGLAASAGFLAGGRLAKLDVGSVVTSPTAYTFRLETDDPSTNAAFGSRESTFDRPWLVVTAQP